MKKNLILVPIIIGLVVIFANTKPIWISSFHLSQQHTVDPRKISEEETNESLAYFDNSPLSIPHFPAVSTPLETDVLGTQDANKRIEIDLTNQRLYAFEGDQMIYNFLISSGKWGRTPTGVFRIWIKLRATKMEGGSKALRTYYYLPNVPFVMYFYNSEIPMWRGYGIHGTYWHDNFGHPMSHGCINMRTEDAQTLYYWANPQLNGKSSVSASGDNLGTQIIIYGEAPWE